MEQTNAHSIQSSIQNYKEGLGHFTETMPKIAKSYNAFTEACFEEGELSKKEKQLMALGISLYSQDEYCIIYHTKGCLDQGCSEQEILEGVGVSAALGGGAAMSQAVTLVTEAMQEFQNQPKH